MSDLRIEKMTNKLNSIPDYEWYRKETIQHNINVVKALRKRSQQRKQIMEEYENGQH